MTSTSHPRSLASVLVALVAAGALLLGTTPALAQSAVGAAASQNGTPARSDGAGTTAAPPHDTLPTGGTLAPGDQLTSKNGLFHAVMQTDGDLVGDGPDGMIWHTGTRGAGNRFVMQDDGDAVVLGTDGSVEWSSGTAAWSTDSNVENLAVELDDSGVLTIVDDEGDLGWDSQSQLPGSVLYAPNHLSTGDVLRSDDGLYLAVMQSDGNLVVHGPTGLNWQTGTHGIANGLYVAENGVASIYDWSDTVVWANRSASGATGPFHFVLGNDGKLVEYDGQGHVVWSSR
ncbi:MULTISPECIES: hypothetical protein [unclassified Rathayibacter]|uniref:hypothetical protein n=1 Tax=unclassified Rathayibacter TaxID=2609250 RepID=UPI001FB2F817|nr:MULTISPECIES: hypothetical protein [unclassified Rathayibacter]MCJ1673046.1 hypothetical protein [Rathayibacter sp. VKM Ac-2929]MCJ1682542.1 hypothetical protein [Rathayibacter sp. VKM Ac-2928]